MIVFLNGRFVPEEQALVSVFDRSFRWDQHMERLGHGAEFLKLKLPFTVSALQSSAKQLIAQNRMRDGLMRVTVSRGVGLRGYSPKGANQPTVVMSLHPFVDGLMEGRTRECNWKLVTASFRLPSNERVAQFKTCNKLSQILARAEADAAGADEALLLNTDGFVVEGASSNLFWIEEGVVCTPPLPSGILAGVTRAVVLELCSKLQLQAHEACAHPEQLKRADGVFVSLSSMGVVPAESLDGSQMRSSPVIEKLRTAYDELVRHETGGQEE
jgi:branched-chain amino acid aminotransferase